MILGLSQAISQDTLLRSSRWSDREVPSQLIDFTDIQKIGGAEKRNRAVEWCALTLSATSSR